MDYTELQVRRSSNETDAVCPKLFSEMLDGFLQRYSIRRILHFSLSGQNRIHFGRR
jgi:hypothetical protein